MTDDTPNTEQYQQQTPPSPDTEPGNNTGSEQTFTQADIDRIILDRLKRDREVQRKKLLEDLDVSSLNDAKTILQAERERQESELSEIEKLNKRIESLESEKVAAEQRAQEIESARVKDRQQSALRRALQDANAKDVDNLLILANAKHADDISGAFKTDDPTAADDGKMKALVKQIASDLPSFFGTAGAGSPSNAGGVSPLSAERAEDEARQEINRKFGRL